MTERGSSPESVPFAALTPPPLHARRPRRPEGLSTFRALWVTACAVFAAMLAQLLVGLVVSVVLSILGQEPAGNPLLVIATVVSGEAAFLGVALLGARNDPAGWKAR